MSVRVMIPGQMSAAANILARLIERLGQVIPYYSNVLVNVYS